MKKKDIVVGKSYRTKSRIVKIVSESPYGGWDGINVGTGRKVRIKTAAKLKGEYIE